MSCLMVSSWSWSTTTSLPDRSSMSSTSNIGARSSPSCSMDSGGAIKSSVSSPKMIPLPGVNPASPMNFTITHREIRPHHAHLLLYSRINESRVMFPRASRCSVCHRRNPLTKSSSLTPLPSVDPWKVMKASARALCLEASSASCPCLLDKNATYSDLLTVWSLSVSSFSNRSRALTLAAPFSNLPGSASSPSPVINATQVSQKHGVTSSEWTSFSRLSAT
mmetsp:Transcript_3532/g.8924  ORF Transcript_3532/g.8924 Transcript_3532/m.8924 type:complete len:221 (-) Transcript_3532:424-1086(-)